MALRPHELRRILLDLIGWRHSPELVAGLGEHDWRILDAMAAQHRLQPILHAHGERELVNLAIPRFIREGWRKAHRASGIRALAKRKVLLETNGLLASRGIRAVALKGAWAAWHAYAAPAERPMRDVDLLVGEERALDAFKLLLAQGYRQEEASARTPERSLAHDKHLPPLLAPDGVRLELHMRLWERSEAIGWPMPADESAAMLARAAPTGDDPVTYLSAEDRLVHAVVHGAYSNRLNGGPVTLLDIAAIVRLGGVDWPSFWQRAESGGWARGAGLLFHLADRYCRRGLLAETGCTLTIAPEVWVNAPELLLQDLEARKAVGMVAGVTNRLREDGLRGAAIAALDRMRGKDRGIHREGVSEGPSESFARWAARRLGESASALSSGEVRAVARGTNRLGEWLDGGR
ncbi:nucleotidyltransferase family protein [Erythrobacter sp. SDW2]|uniref:nucleotidyltransferase domain-containing protein n=1 Tax=Erythrobacter sp. SDW2 TaxID=2907154 RepID=UPI001F359734|nr:nucleotidyltransferase family protein [Erythrobacter sp. SDW2]UIP07465.1 nucleotidyltransferase family protein [Erythrobacter sp. SDW2]